MKPVAILQHTEIGAPGALLDVFDRLDIPWQRIAIVDGDPIPQNAEPYAGLVLMGGYMGVNDRLPWMLQEMALIHDADARGLPVAGHCLGSQLLAHAFGAEIRRNPLKEIGWQRIRVEPDATAEAWFALPGGSEHEVFQWHGDTFDIPPGAVRIAGSAHCANQAYVIGDRHLGMQFHLEMTPDLIARSLARNGHELHREVAQGNPAAGSRADTAADSERRTAVMHDMMTRLYRRWSQALAR